MNKLLLYGVLLLISSHAPAESFRCGRSIVKEGESTNALMKKCGNPLRKYSGKETINDHGRPSRVDVSNWVYERKGKKDMIVSVRSGAIVNIQVD